MIIIVSGGLPENRPAETKKPQVTACGGSVFVEWLTQPQASVRRFGKVIPMPNAPGKLLTARIHEQQASELQVRVKRGKSYGPAESRDVGIRKKISHWNSNFEIPILPA